MIEGRQVSPWFVAHTLPHSEDRAAQHLRRQGVETYLPRCRVRRRHARRLEWVLRPLFPRYVFLRFDDRNTSWRSVRSTIGVSSLVCNGNEPACIAEQIINGLRSREDENGAITLITPLTWEIGQKLQVVAGAFAEQIGFFEGQADEERIILLMKLLGRDVHVRVPVDAVAVAS